MKVNGFIIMGVSGCGKSTIGRLLAEKLDWDFLDADNFHLPENIAKMTAGIPLNDADRAPWLSALHRTLSSTLKAGRHPVLACSALRESYRYRLCQGNDGLKIIYLKGSYDVIWSRMIGRKGHYMTADMLKSQFDALEEPLNAMVMDVRLTPDEIVQKIIGVTF